VQVERRGEERCGTPRCAAVRPAITAQHAGGAVRPMANELEKKSQFSASQRRRPHLATGSMKLTDRRTTELLSYCGIAAESFGYKLHIEFHTGS
jgi:hypothetical protein